MYDDATLLFYTFSLLRRKLCSFQEPPKIDPKQKEKYIAEMKEFLKEGVSRAIEVSLHFRFSEEFC